MESVATDKHFSLFGRLVSYQKIECCEYQESTLQVSTWKMFF